MMCKFKREGNGETTRLEKRIVNKNCTIPFFLPALRAETLGDLR
jgi:hypothetical protein